MVSCEDVSGRKRNPLIVAYLPMSTLDHLWNLEEVLNQLPERNPIITENLNIDIVQLQNPWSHQV